MANTIDDIGLFAKLIEISISKGDGFILSLCEYSFLPTDGISKSTLLNTVKTPGK